MSCCCSSNNELALHQKLYFWVASLVGLISKSCHTLSVVEKSKSVCNFIAQQPKELEQARFARCSGAYHICSVSGLGHFCRGPTHLCGPYKNVGAPYFHICGYPTFLQGRLFLHSLAKLACFNVIFMSYDGQMYNRKLFATSFEGY